MARKLKRYAELIPADLDSKLNIEALEELYNFLYHDLQIWWMGPMRTICGPDGLREVMAQEAACIQPTRDRVTFYYRFGLVDGQPKLPSQIATLLGGSTTTFGYVRYSGFVSRLFRRFLELEEVTNPKPKLSSPIERLKFSVRVQNALKRRYIHTIRDLVQTPKSYFDSIRYFGPKMFDEVKKKLEQYGFEPNW